MRRGRKVGQRDPITSLGSECQYNTMKLFNKYNYGYVMEIYHYSGCHPMLMHD